MMEDISTDILHLQKIDMEDMSEDDLLLWQYQIFQTYYGEPPNTENIDDNGKQFTGSHLAISK